MKLGFIGLGKMGKNLAAQMLEKGHRLVVYNRTQTLVYSDPEIAKALKATSLKHLVRELGGKKVVWIMVTAGSAFDEIVFGKGGLARLLKPGDIVVDGGNSRFTDTLRRGQELAKRKIHFVDAGVSGGPYGARTGASVMVGGEDRIVKKLEPLFESIALPNGYAHVGPLGAGHFVKMVHNGIEYGWMQALGEGLELIKRSPIQDINLLKTVQVWQHGSVIESKLVTLTARALKKNPMLKGVLDYIADTGEGRWTIETAIQAGVPANAMAAAVFARFSSQLEHGENAAHSFAAKVLNALRNEFGGHEVKKG